MTDHETPDTPVTVETPPEAAPDNVVELPTLDARHLEVIHAVMGAAILEVIACNHLVLAGKPVDVHGVSEKFLRLVTVSLVKHAREVYNQPYPSRVERFQAIATFISRELAAVSTELYRRRPEEIIETPPAPVIVDPMGRPVR